MDLEVVKTTPVTEPMNQLNIGANFVQTDPVAGLFGSGHERFVRAGPAAEGPAGRRSC
jgi:hypothetical protein